MRRQKPQYSILLFLLLGAIAVITACRKEYSYEGRPLNSPDTTNIPDPLTPTGTTFPACIECNNTDTSTYKWSFKVGSSPLCGKVTKAVLSPNRDAMTFFGPSVCSADSGLIITAYFNNQALNKDQSNVTADRASLQYYDNTTGADVLLSKPPNIFSLTIDNYIRSTGVTIGSFGGSVVDKNGNIIKVDAGRFKIKF